MYNRLCALRRQSRGINDLFVYNEPFLLENKSHGFPRDSATLPSAPLNIWPHRRFQYYLLANTPTPTPRENMHLISYAQRSLKIVLLWCKVRSKFDRLSVAHSRWFSLFSLPPSCPALEKYPFAWRSQEVPTEWVSDRKTERGRISVTIWESDGVSQNESVSYCPCFQASV